MNSSEDIKKVLKGFLEETPLNRLEELGGIRIYDEPLVEIASADDPLFEELKKPDVVGKHHLSPKEWLPEAASVISFFLPFSREIRNANAAQKDLPALEWLCGRYEGEAVNDAVRGYLVDMMVSQGYKAASPMRLMDSFLRGEEGHEKRVHPLFDVQRFTSNWSERHVAYVAGLGTFSLSRALITEKGCAGRFGSVITDRYIEPSKRKYNKYDEYCTYCGACIKRCPSNAISTKGKNKETCGLVSDRNKKLFAPRYGCGLCYTGVPCEGERP